LFNHRHSAARNVIERIFGVLKKRFQILKSAPEYPMNVQAQIPAALAALHNFIREFDPDDLHAYDDDEEFDYEFQDPPDSESIGELGVGLVTSSERVRANERRDRIAAEMWEQYQNYVESRVA
jgi:hypothetical protein